MRLVTQSEYQVDTGIVFGMTPLSPVHFRRAMVEMVDGEKRSAERKKRHLEMERTGIGLLRIMVVTSRMQSVRA